MDGPDLGKTAGACCQDSFPIGYQSDGLRGKQCAESYSDMTVDRIPTNRGNIPLRRWWKSTLAKAKGESLILNACIDAGIQYPHFKHVAAGRRRMSPETAAVFVKASRGALTFEQLMPIAKRAPR